MATAEDSSKTSRSNAGKVSRLFGSCPIPIFDHKHIVLGHGSGGKLTAELIDKVFLPAFRNPVLDKLDDQAVRQHRRHASGLHHRFVRRHADLLSRRRHRPARGERHGQRSGHERRPPALSLGRVHPGRRPARRRSAPRGGIHARRRRRGRRAARHRRHQGRRIAARATRSSSPRPASA